MLTEAKPALNREGPPKGEEPFVVVAILKTSHGNFHVGLLYRNPSTREPVVLHHPWHRTPLQEDPDTSRYAWVENKLSPLIARLIVARCRAVFEKNKEGLAYAFQYSAETHFNGDGLLVSGKGNHGLTCATFILAVLNGCGIKILDESNWPHSSSDDPWAQEILAWLERFDPDHTALLGQCTEAWARFCPEDVAAASGLPIRSPPPGRAQVEPHGKAIAGQL